MRSLFVIAVLVVSVVAGAEERAVPGKTKTAFVEGVTISVTPLNLTASGSTTMDFQVTMETHQGALPSEMLRIAKLLGDEGEEIAASAWTGGRGGHHLTGKLSFPSGTLGTSGTVTLIFKGVSGQNMRFEWKIPSNVAAGKGAS